jgi:intracellular sulfur oxidation DsrE/DsrF family protein
MVEFRTLSTDPKHVILHISESDRQRFETTLDQAESILEQYRGQGTQVEIIANAGGLDLLCASVPERSARIRRMMKVYDNIRFIACNDALKRMLQHGRGMVLIEGVHTGISAGDHLIQRIQDGWTYLRM